MREAIITVTSASTDERPEPYTQVFRVEFEGDFGITGEANNTDTFELKNVVASERLVGESTTVPSLKG